MVILIMLINHYFVNSLMSKYLTGNLWNKINKYSTSKNLITISYKMNVRLIEENHRMAFNL